MKIRRAPKSPLTGAPLSAEARRFTKALATEYGIADAGGQAILRVAAEALDRLRSAQAAIDRDGLITRDRWGAPKTHPAATVERDARAQLLMAIRQLGLDLEPVKPIGRPGSAV